MFAVYLYHEEERRKENPVRDIGGQQYRTMVFHQAAVAQACIILNTLISGFCGFLCVQQCPTGHSEVTEMFYICTVQYNGHWILVAI